MCDLAESPKPWHQKAEVPWQTTHDDLTIQYPIEPDLTDMAQCILDISQHFLRPVLRYPPHEFQLDTDTKIGFKYGDPTRERPYAGLIKLAYKEPTLEAMTEALRETIDKLRSQT